MNSTRTDAFDPKLQYHYRLQQALILIQDQDKIISKQATDIQHLKNVVTSMQENSIAAYDLFEKALTHVSKNMQRGFHLW